MGRKGARERTHSDDGKVERERLVLDLFDAFRQRSQPGGVLADVGRCVDSSVNHVEQVEGSGDDSIAAVEGDEVDEAGGGSESGRFKLKGETFLRRVKLVLLRKKERRTYSFSRGRAVCRDVEPYGGEIGVVQSSVVRSDERGIAFRRSAGRALLIHREGF